MRARATDAYGNQGAFSSPLVLPVDLTPPSVALDPTVDQFLADGVIGPTELGWRGSLRTTALPRRWTCVPTRTTRPAAPPSRPPPAIARREAGAMMLGEIVAGDGTQPRWRSSGATRPAIAQPLRSRAHSVSIRLRPSSPSRSS